MIECDEIDDKISVNFKSGSGVDKRKQTESSGWRKVYDFLYKSDDRNYFFVMNQLRRTLGNRKPIKKNRRRITAEGRQKVEEKKKLFFDKLSAAKIFKIIRPTTLSHPKHILTTQNISLSG